MSRPTRVLSALFAGNRKLVLLAVWFVAISLLATLAFTSSTDTIYDISFGFGPFIQSLVESGRYEGCDDGGFCTNATRMPGLPLFFAGIGVFTTDLLVAALVKTVVLTVGVLVCFRYLLRAQPGAVVAKSWVWFLAAGLLAGSPAVIKHATTVHYEEGFLIQVMFLWAFAFLLSVRRLGQSKGEETTGGTGVLVLAVALACLAYLFKSSMIIVLGLTLAVALAGYLRSRRRAIVLAMAACVAAVLAWGVHTQVTTGHFSVMTSFDGQNAYRGANDQAEAIYPELYLDRLFDSMFVYPLDGQVVRLPDLPALNEFEDEWAQDRYYKDKAAEWTWQNPGAAASFAVEKVQNFFVGIRKTPYTYDVDARDLPMGAEDLLTSAWLLAGRVLQVVMLGLLVAVWRLRERSSRFLVGGVVLANAAYAAPYLVGFNYERHVTTYLVVVAACVGVLAVERFGRVAGDERPADPNDAAVPSSA